MNDVSRSSGSLLGHYYLTTVPFLLFSLSFAYVSHHIFLVLSVAPPHYPILPISLNSLDLAGFEIAESPWLTDTIIPDAGPGDFTPGDEYELKWEFDKDSQRYYVSFPDDQ